MSDTREAAGKRAPARRRWRMPWLQLVACLVILAGTCVFLYPHIASWFSQRDQSRVVELSREWMQQPPNNDATHRAQQLERARRYNKALASGAVYAANAHVATSKGRSTDTSLDYWTLLNLDGSGYLGRVRYGSLGIDLPIYHGTSDATLQHGVGHLEGTSLPVGGAGERAVLTAHRGLPTATLFNELNRAAVGDTFTVSVLDEALSYRVIETRVIRPDQTEAILPDPGRDLVTLVTCTPLGINSHRILVTGERIVPPPLDEVAAAQAAPDLPGFPWWAVVLGGVVVFVVGDVWRCGYRLPAPPS
ncbi:MAG: class C sortase [Micropruina sp.]|uniref:class C sortase n=1 Tax=Micropruina sp. TaxID=2737536 RepID=UPI0039E5FD12